ncbi:amino acid permease [Williamsoniiplasma somnilux]|uniref:Amino acid permease n=1 Tax=Williamsoniiplasma somnilux TaxID=215578 RepID=A0A2K8NY26_9MOLU|nr:APC family permease [Williamsoniiplasma somnilux]ATZ18456.1 amino acid permease [Williamsoniiplasma somnilux]
MQKTSGTKTKSFEFLTLFTMVIGTVIGTGIYMKNNELLNQTQNPIVAIILWIIVGFICVLSVAVFIEISSSTKHVGNGTVANWTKLFINRKTASMFSIFYMLMYIPSTQSFFVGSFIMYLFKAMGVVVDPAMQLTIYLAAGLFILGSFSFLHIYGPKYGRGIQVFGTIFKFIPLVVAFVAGFILMDKTPGGTSSMWNNGGINHAGDWSTSNFTGTAFIGGFGAILFSFDGYIYIANAQRDATHKEVVPKALFFGMIFVAIFYTLMAISLFLGSPDGSIVRLLEKVFSGGKTGDEISQTVQSMSRILSNIILMIICFLNINVFTYIGSIDVESDAQVGLLYQKDPNKKMSRAYSTWLQTSIVAAVYCALIILGFALPIEYIQWNGFSTIISSQEALQGDVFYKPLTLMGDFASAISATSFLCITTVIFAAIWNRKTNKVKVDKVRLFLPLAWISGIMITIFTILGVFSFVVPANVLNGEKGWMETDGFIFTVFLIVSLIINYGVYRLQEIFFKKQENELQNTKKI